MNISPLAPVLKIDDALPIRLIVEPENKTMVLVASICANPTPPLRFSGAVRATL